jgi:hypothetical protein
MFYDCKSFNALEFSIDEIRMIFLEKKKKEEKKLKLLRQYYKIENIHYREKYKKKKKKLIKLPAVYNIAPHLNVQKVIN